MHPIVFLIENNIKEKKSVYVLSSKFIDLRILKLEKKIDSINLLISNFKITKIFKRIPLKLQKVQNIFF